MFSRQLFLSNESNGYLRIATEDYHFAKLLDKMFCSTKTQMNEARTVRHTTLGLAIAGLTYISSASVLLSAVVRAEISLLNFLFLISSLVILLGCGYGLTIIKFPAIAKPYRCVPYKLTISLDENIFPNLFDNIFCATLETDIYG